MRSRRSSMQVDGRPKKDYSELNARVRQTWCVPRTDKPPPAHSGRQESAVFGAEPRSRRCSRLFAPMVGSKKDSYWAQYQDLLIRRPVAMNITQGGIITAAGNVVAQMVTESTVKAQPLIEQVLLTVCFIAPVVSKWIPFLGGLRLHWAKATAVDQVLHRPQLRPGLGVG